MYSPKLPRMGGAAPPIDSDENPVVRDGLEAWERLKAASRMTLKDWLIVGAALVEGRTHAIAAAKTNKPSGPKYSQQFHFWMEINGFAEIDKATRSKLLWLMESWPQVEKWLEGKTKAERVKWNHPHTMWVAFRCTKRGIKAVLEKAEAPIPNPKDLPPPTKFEEDDDEFVWQRGLFGRVRKAIRDMAIEDRWLLPEPPDDGLLESVEQLITTATTLRDQLRRARQSTPGESRHQQQPALESA